MVLWLLIPAICPAIFFGPQLFKRLKASPASDAGFLPDAEKLVPLPERSPFNATWYSNRDRFFAMKNEYRAIFIAPIGTERLNSKIRNLKLGKRSEGRRIAAARELALYARERFEREIEDYPAMPTKVVQAAGAKTFILEIELVELKPTNPVLNAVGLFLPGTVFIKVAGAGSIAMEGLLRDGETGEILVEVKDREKDKTTLFSVRDFWRYCHARRTIDEWARVFAELLATPYEHRVGGLSPVTINPF